MAIIFPASPTLNDVFTAGDRQWKWNGTSWQSIVVGESDPTMGGDLLGTASTAQIIADVVGSTELATTGTASSSTFLAGNMAWSIVQGSEITTPNNFFKNWNQSCNYWFSITNNFWIC